MVKIFIDPGHGGTDPGAAANEIQEKNITLQISSIIRDILLSEYEDVSVLMSRTGDETVSLDSRTNAANNWGADYYVSVHINSGGGSGFESYVYPGVARQTVTYQEIIHQKIMEHTLLSNRGMKQADFHVLRESNMDAILTENGFIDNAADAAQLKDSSFIDHLARGHVLGIAAAFHLTAKIGNSQILQPEPTIATGLFSVQIGAFSEQSNAEKLAFQAKEKGFHTFIKQENAQYKVQIGAFKEREYAEELIQKAKNAGLAAFITID
ncbi:N-acetylmuramoyl-L-alanine amidase [Bacillus benzoevorans]|uniref:N-acetylmuramoyl-L-alanine amidase n=1 Tax=Bacillus benzoevorans TaxID=1456 RepID=A0A7X0HQN6_9BACI|nr:N-acetylmuramoyl-L-alanine amidase [Bacillus benzoevorans]MBB6445170.1 N-acetylmuramoyl-L-alanine amidase [Bacillus benzoevorans]